MKKRLALFANKNNITLHSKLDKTTQERIINFVSTPHLNESLDILLGLSKPTKGGTMGILNITLNKTSYWIMSFSGHKKEKGTGIETQKSKWLQTLKKKYTSQEWHIANYCDPSDSAPNILPFMSLAQRHALFQKSPNKLEEIGNKCADDTLRLYDGLTKDLSDNELKKALALRISKNKTAFYFANTAIRKEELTHNHLKILKEQWERDAFIHNLFEDMEHIENTKEIKLLLENRLKQSRSKVSFKGAPKTISECVDIHYNLMIKKRLRALTYDIHKTSSSEGVRKAIELKLIGTSPRFFNEDTIEDVIKKSILCMKDPEWMDDPYNPINLAKQTIISLYSPLKHNTVFIALNNYIKIWKDASLSNLLRLPDEETKKIALLNIVHTIYSVFREVETALLRLETYKSTDEIDEESRVLNAKKNNIEDLFKAYEKMFPHCIALKGPKELHTEIWKMVSNVLTIANFTDQHPYSGNFEDHLLHYLLDAPKESEIKKAFIHPDSLLNVFAVNLHQRSFKIDDISLPESMIISSNDLSLFKYRHIETKLKTAQSYIIGQMTS